MTGSVLSGLLKEMTTQRNRFVTFTRHFYEGETITPKALKEQNQRATIIIMICERLIIIILRRHTNRLITLPQLERVQAKS